MEDASKTKYLQPRRPRLALVTGEIPEPKSRSWFRLRKTYEHLSWKEELYLNAAILAIAIGSTLLATWIIEGGLTLESRLGYCRMTPAKKEQMY